MLVLNNKLLLHSVVIIVRGLRFKVLRVIVELIHIAVVFLWVEFYVHLDAIVATVLEHVFIVFLFLLHYLLDHFLVLGLVTVVSDDDL